MQFFVEKDGMSNMVYAIIMFLCSSPIKKYIFMFLSAVLPCQKSLLKLGHLLANDVSVGGNPPNGVCF